MADELIELLEDVQPWLMRSLGDVPMWGVSATSVLFRVQDMIETLRAAT